MTIALRINIALAAITGVLMLISQFTPIFWINDGRQNNLRGVHLSSQRMQWYWTSPPENWGPGSNDSPVPGWHFETPQTQAYPIGGLLWPRVLRSGSLSIWCVPCWLLGIGPAIGSVVLWKLRRRCAGACKACDYDLAGNTTGRCPECGATFPAGAVT